MCEKNMFRVCRGVCVEFPLTRLASNKPLTIYLLKHRIYSERGRNINRNNAKPQGSCSWCWEPRTRSNITSVELFPPIHPRLACAPRSVYVMVPPRCFEANIDKMVVQGCHEEVFRVGHAVTFKTYCSHAIIGTPRVAFL